MTTLAGKVALVTGGNRGIGKAICELLLENKVKVCFTGRSEKVAEEALKEFQGKFGAQNVVFRKLDVNNEKEMEETMKFTKTHFGGHFDIFINNAGISDEINWRSLIETNLTSAIAGMKLAEKYLGGPSTKGGYIVSTASIFGLRCCHTLPVYCATKFGIVGMTLAMGHQNHVKRTGIKVTAVCPDITDTPMVAAAADNKVEEFKETAHQLTNMSKINPREIGEAVVKLIKDNRSAEFLVVSRSKGTYYYPIPKDDAMFVDGVI